MKKLLLPLLLLTGIAVSAFPLKNVIIPRQPSANEQAAANELVLHLRHFEPEAAVITEPDGQPPEGIYLGATDFAKSSGINGAAFGRDEWLLQRLGNRLVIAGGAPVGTLYGVYEFLEKYCGITWLDQYYTDFPETMPELPAKLQERGRPAFAWRGIYTIFNQGPGRVEFLIRNRENIFFEDRQAEEVIRNWGFRPMYGAPGCQDTLYRYIKLWPENGIDTALSLSRDGKRERPVKNTGPGQVCYSSNQARKLFAEQLEKFIKADREAAPENYPTVYCIIQNDVDARCECPECLAREKKYGAYSGVLLEFVNFLAAGIAEKYPDILIQTDAYMNTEFPPVSGIRPEPNVRVRYTPFSWSKKHYDMMRPLTISDPERAKACRTWGELGRIHVWDYWVLFGAGADNNAAIINTEAIAENLRLYKKCGAESVFSECEFSDGVSFNALRVWLGYKLKMNPEQPVEQLLDRFFRGYYRQAASPMRRLYYLQEDRQDQTANLNAGDASAREWLDGAFFRRAEKLLAEAEQAAAGNEEILRHIAKERVVLDIARIRRCEDIPGLPGLDEVKKRLRANWPEVIHRTYWGDREKRRLATMEKFFKMSERGAVGARYSLPAGVNADKVHEIPAAEINWLSQVRSYGTELVDDPGSETGKSVVIAKTTRTNPEAFHAKNARGFRFGIYSETKKGHIQQSSLSKRQIPADEAYHWYKLPPAALDPATLVWASDWLIQHRLDNLYAGKKRYTVYLSLKFTGPAYVKNSKQANAVYCDRILAVETE